MELRDSLAPELDKWKCYQKLQEDLTIRRVTLLDRHEKLLQIKIDLSQFDISKLQQENKDLAAASSKASKALTDAEAMHHALSKQHSNAVSKAKEIRVRVDKARKDMAGTTSGAKQAEEASKSNNRMQQLFNKRLTVLRDKSLTANKADKDAVTALDALLKDQAAALDAVNCIQVDQRLHKQSRQYLNQSDDVSHNKSGSSKSHDADLTTCESRLREAKRRQARKDRELQQVPRLL